MIPNTENPKGKELIIRELRRWFLFLLLGFSFIIFNQDVGSRKFPMGLSQEWIEKARFLGWLILIGGYPTSLLIRLFHFLIKRNKQSNPF